MNKCLAFSYLRQQSLREQPKRYQSQDLLVYDFMSYEEVIFLAVIGTMCLLKSHCWMFGQTLSIFLIANHFTRCKRCRMTMCARLARP